MIKKFMTILATATLVACGGGGSADFNIDIPSVDKTPTSRYVGNYDVCDEKGTEKVLTITEPADNVLTLSYVTNVYRFNDCSGEKTTQLDTPPAVTFKYRYTNTYDIYGFAAPGNWGTTAIDVGDSSSAAASSSVYGLVLDQGRLFYAKRKTSAAGKEYFDTVEWFLLKGR
jgi:hypothetical protein